MERSDGSIMCNGRTERCDNEGPPLKEMKEMPHLDESISINARRIIESIWKMVVDKSITASTRSETKREAVRRVSSCSTFVASGMASGSDFEEANQACMFSDDFTKESPSCRKAEHDQMQKETLGAENYQRPQGPQYGLSGAELLARYKGQQDERCAERELCSGADLVEHYRTHERNGGTINAHDERLSGAELLERYKNAQDKKFSGAELLEFYRTEPTRFDNRC
eukprot:GHVO01068979.1.p1 GENE.GHVO01068979.1~~GHVO01068979.1.p1  ORF type:complete len:225 (+),score=19.58 GHVO01068979.1:139-813(+)